MHSMGNGAKIYHLGALLFGCYQDCLSNINSASNLLLVCFAKNKRIKAFLNVGEQYYAFDSAMNMRQTALQFGSPKGEGYSLT